MGISTDAVRTRVRRGTLATVREQSTAFVVWPQPDRMNDRRPRTERRSERHSPVQDDARLVAALEARIGSREAQLTWQTQLLAAALLRIPDVRAGHR